MLVVVTSPDHELAGLDEVNFLDTLKYDQVCLQEGNAIGAFLRQIAGEYQRVQRTRIRVANFEAACRIIEANVAIGIVPESSVLRYAKSMRIRHARLSDDWSVRNLSICVKCRESLPGSARDLIDMMLDDLALTVAA